MTRRLLPAADCRRLGRGAAAHLCAALAALACLPGLAGAQLRIGGSGLVGSVEHRVNAGRGVEAASGIVLGGAFVLGVGPRIEIVGSGFTGALNADSANADDVDLARFEGALVVSPVPYLAVRGGLSVHTRTTKFAAQRWTAPRLGAEGRLAFLGGSLRGVVRLEFLPAVSVSDLDAPNRAIAAGAGLQWASGLLTAGVEYALERYDFPEVQGVERREQLTMLTAQLGLRLGRR